MQVDRTLLASYHFVYNYEVAVVYEEYGTTVFQVFVAGVFGNQYLYITFRLPQFGYRFSLIQILVVQSYGVVYASLTVPVTLFHYFSFTGVYIRTGIGEQVLTVEPEFESTVIRLAVPESFRAGLYNHLCGIRSPRVTEYEETGFQETFREIFRQCTFFTIGCQILDELVLREHLAPATVVLQHFFLIGQLSIAEARVGIVRERNVGIEYNHVFNCIQVFLRELVAETVQVGNVQCFTEDIDGSEVIVRVKLELSAVIVYLYIDFTVHDVDTALSPGSCFFEFGEESSGINHTLCFEQQVITLLGIITQYMYGMFVIVYQELSQELRCERGRREEQLEL